MKATTPAVGYLRRSTEKQEKSLDDQRREVERYAKEHDYRIVRWYEDDGISGDDTERRAGFKAMHEAATDGRDFDCILVWDQDRFGRFNSIEAGYWVHPLVKAGVKLVTVNEGLVNWTDFTGRIMYSLKQEGKHQFLVDLSRNVARGQITTAKAGYLNGQRAPYGYDRMLVDEQGEHRQRVKTGQEFSKPKSWKVTLVPSDNPEEVKTVKWLFQTYSRLDVGLRSMAEDLNRKGIPSPGGGPWWLATIREILRNPVYCGDLVWARRRCGKYHRVAAGQITPRTTEGGAKVKINPQEEWIVVKDAHPALVDRATWQIVQAKLVRRRGRTTPRRRELHDRYLLSGLVYCGHCGRRMHASMNTRRRGRKVYRWEKYLCSTYKQIGSTQGCGYHAVEQQALVDFLVTKLRETVLASDHRGELRKKVLQRLRSRTEVDPSRVKQLQHRIAELEQQMRQGTERLLKAPEDITDLLAPQLSAWRKERDRLADEMELAARPTGKADLEGEADRVVGHLWTLADELQNAKPARLRELFQRMVSRIDLWFDHVARGTKYLRCPLSKGTIELRADPAMFPLDNSGGWI